jgi:hypothetical protein
MFKTKKRLDKIEEALQLLVKQQITEKPSETKLEKEKREELEKSWNELFTYNEFIAVKGGK